MIKEEEEEEEDLGWKNRWDNESDSDEGEES